MQVSFSHDVEQSWRVVGDFADHGLGRSRSSSSASPESSAGSGSVSSEPNWFEFQYGPKQSILNVRVEGLGFEYELTEDDVREVFSRYGQLIHVTVDREGAFATVQFSHPHIAGAAQRELNGKNLTGSDLSGAYLRVEFPPASVQEQALISVGSSLLREGYAVSSKYLKE